MKVEQMPKVALGNFPTPLQSMENLAKELGCGPLYIKRDDLSDVALGGNKIRKLEYLVADAKAKGYNTLLTLGGPQTNHGRLTVGAAVRYGMKSILVLNGSRPDTCSGNLVLDRMMGADLYFIGDRNRQVVIDEVVAAYEAQGDRVYVIPVGGSNEIGAAGYIQMIPELMEQIKAQGIQPKYMVCGAGSLGTYAGLWLGAKYYHAPFEVVGICVGTEADYPLAYAVEYANQVSAYYEMGIVCTAEELHIVYDSGEAQYAGLGYNVPDPVTRSYMNLMARTEAVILDPCYTGKVFHGMVDLVQTKKLDPAAGTIFLHTGGFPAIWTKEHLDAAQEELWG